MSEYVIRRWNGAAPDLSDRIFAPENEPFCGLPAAEIAIYPWDESGYCPRARAYVGRNEKGLVVLMCAEEEKIISAETEFGGAVCRDSCLELFLNPRPSAGGEYVNVEVSCAGVMHIGFGSGRSGRRVLKTMPEGVNVTHSRHEGGWWAVSYCLPFDLIGECEDEMRGNFYTCDETLHEHYGCWNSVIAPQPDFHRPECFGAIRMED